MENTTSRTMDAVEESAQLDQVSEQKSPYVGFWVRLAAYLIDNFLLSIVSLPVGFVIGILIAIIDQEAVGVVLYILSYLIGFIITFAYFIFFTHKYQATLGKMAVGVEVMAESGGHLSLGKIVLRETLGKIVSALIFMVGYIMAAFTGKKQALHDMMSHSVVIYKDPVVRARKWVVGVVLGLHALLIILGLIFLIGVFALVGASFMSDDFDYSDFDSGTYDYYDENYGSEYDNYYDDDFNDMHYDQGDVEVTPSMDNLQ